MSTVQELVLYLEQKKIPIYGEFEDELCDILDKLEYLKHLLPR